MGGIRSPHVIYPENFREEMQMVLASGPTKDGKGNKRLLLTFRSGTVSYRVVAKDGASKYEQAMKPRNLYDFELAIDAYNEL